MAGIITKPENKKMAPLFVELLARVPLLQLLKKELYGSHIQEQIK